MVLGCSSHPICCRAALRSAAEAAGALVATFPCVHIPVIDLLYKTCAVICVERLVDGVNRPFADTHTSMYGEFGEASPLGLWEDVEMDPVVGMDPNVGLRFPLLWVGSS